MVHAPQRPAPQPNFVPVSLSCSRITHRSGVAGGASVDAGRPFTTKFVAIGFLPAPSAEQGRRSGAGRIVLQNEGSGKNANALVIASGHKPSTASLTDGVE